MTEKQTLKLLYKELSPYIIPEIKGTLYTISDIIALACREGGSKVVKLLGKGLDIDVILGNFLGDSGHGHSIYQIDDRSYLPWIKTGAWMHLGESTKKCIEVLEEKRRFLEHKGYNARNMGYADFKMAVFCAYNCGQGNVYKALRSNQDPNNRTAHKNYGREVMRLSRLIEEISQAQAIGGEDKTSEKEFKQGTKS